MLMNCKNLTILDLIDFKPGQVYSMNNMLKNCINLEELNICNFDTRCTNKYYEQSRTTRIFF